MLPEYTSTQIDPVSESFGGISAYGHTVVAINTHIKKHIDKYEDARQIMAQLTRVGLRRANITASLESYKSQLNHAYPYYDYIIEVIDIINNVSNDISMCV